MKEEKEADLQSVNTALRESRAAALNLMRDAVAAREMAERTNEQLRKEIAEKERAQLALKESEERFSKAFHSNPAALSISRLEDGLFVDVNETFVHLFGYEKNELIGKRSTELNMFINPDERTNMLRGLKEEGKVSNYEYTTRNKKGELMTTLVSAEKISIGGQDHVLYATLNITERKRNEEILRESREQLAAVFNGVAETLMLIDIEGNILAANKIADQRLNHDHPGFVGQNIFKIIPEQFHETRRKKIGELIRTKQPIKFHDKLGETELEISFYPVFDDRGYVKQFISSALDITESKRAEEAIRESQKENARLAKLIELASQPFAIGYPDGTMGMGNHAFELLTGYTQEELKSIQWNSMLTPPEYTEMEDRILKELIRTGNPVHYEKKYIRKDGTRVPIELSVNVIKDTDGRADYFFAFVSDISERKKNEQNTQQLIRTLRAMQKSSLMMINAMDEQKFLYDVCRIIVEDCGHKMVWIGYKENDRKKSVTPVAYAGFEEGYIDSLNITWADTERGRGPTGTAIRTGRPVICRNMQTDPALKPWRKEALKRGYSSSIVLPLYMETDVFGALNIYSTNPDPFTDEEEKLLSKLAHDLAYGIMAIRLHKSLKEAKEDLELKVEQRTSLLQQAMASLDAEKKRVMDVLNMIPAFVALIDSDYKIPFSNQIYNEAFGKPEKDSCYFHLFGKQAVCDDCKIKEVFDTGKPCFREWTGPDGRVYHKSNFPFTDTNGASLILEMGVDITEKKNLEKIVLSKIIETEENERRRFAGDLHDDLGPTLSAIKLQLNVVSRERTREKQEELLHICDELLSESIEKMRALANNIMPNLIESYGLQTALQAFIDRFEKTSKIRFNFFSTLNESRLGPETELHLYRIITELVNNTVKHSGATEVFIDLDLSATELRLIYSDNGIGYSVEKSPSMKSGIGLQNIRNRVTLIQGTIEFLKKKGKTMVVITKPVD